MYANFILTQAEPAINAGEVDLGRFSSGIFTFPAYPAMLEFGGVIQLAFEEADKPGIYEVELRGTDLATFDTHVLKNWPLDVPPPDLGWKAPRAWTLIVPAKDIAVFGNVDMALDVEVDRAWVARQTILVRNLSLP